MIYAVAVVVACVLAVALDLWVLRSRLLRSKDFWTAYAIVLFFQLVVNGVLTGRSIVTYDPEVIIGLRVAWAPVEDLFFGFAMILSTLSMWEARGRGARPSGSSA